MGVRGFRWCRYVDDLGDTWAVRVDADYAEDPDRGWELTGDTAFAQLPRGWRARAVIGLDETGNTQHALVATTTANLWTGVAPVFGFFASDEAVHFATVIGRRSEKRIIERLSTTP